MTPDPDSLLQILSEAAGIPGVVKKKRTLVLSGQTRIHLDQVEHLGSFVELEVVLDYRQNCSEGVKIAERMVRQLDLKKSDFVNVAYIDLLPGKTS